MSFPTFWYTPRFVLLPSAPWSINVLSQAGTV